MPEPTRVDETLRSAAKRLQDASETPRLDAQILLAHVLERTRSWLLAHPEFQLSESSRIDFERLVKRVQQGEALPYVIGERWFYGRLFSIEPSVLIPRPETELLIEAALDYLRVRPDRRRAIDVGTGSGCIAVTLCAELPDLEMVASDRSFEAVRIARTNAQAHQVAGRIDFIVGDLLKPVAGRFDLICANLPYIPSERLTSLEVAKREPCIALDGGVEGLDLIGRLLKQTQVLLKPGGRMILEIDETHGEQVMKLAGSVLPDWRAELHRDLAGLDRILIVDRKI